MLKAKLSQNGPEHEELSTLPEFAENILFSFPSSDKLIDLFLGEFKKQREIISQCRRKQECYFLLINRPYVQNKQAHRLSK